MGPLILPSGAPIYIDTNILIYSLERVAPYAPLLDIFWQEVSTRQLSVLTSELTVLETLVGPLKAGDSALETLFRMALFSTPDLRLVPVSRAILERSARLRASLAGLRTPDAIHASTAIESSCALFLTNDPVFRRVPTLAVTVLDDVLVP